MSRVIVGKVIEFTRHPFGAGELASDGIQWTTVINTTTANADVTMGIVNSIVPLLVTDGPGGAGTILEMELALTASFASNAGAASAIYEWQGRDNAGTWTTLSNAITKALTTAYSEATYSGYWKPVTNFDAVPFDLRLIVQCNNATNFAKVKIKNSSYVRTIYKIA